MSTSFRTPRRRIEGLGSAKSGTSHFWTQRLTAVALVPLAIWFVLSALALVGADQAAAVVFLGNGVNAVLMLCFLAAAMTHMSLGLQVIIEDYVHQEGSKLVLLMLIRFFAWGLGLAVAFSLLKLALAGTVS